MRTLLLSLTLIGLVNGGYGQGYNQMDMQVPSSKSFEPRKVTPGIDAFIINQEAPLPNGDSYKSFLMRQKLKSDQLFPRKGQNKPKKKSNSSAKKPLVGKGFPLTKARLGGLSVSTYSGGIPNDNALAVSNGDISAWRSQ
ncbi:MAG: hypothetical protein U5L96_17820 [Owenweeksia sp.]|nr:hypothetical protein [Owenweeksia sp.]